MRSTVKKLMWLLLFAASGARAELRSLESIKGILDVKPLLGSYLLEKSSKIEAGFNCKRYMSLDIVTAGNQNKLYWEPLLLLYSLSPELVVAYRRYPDQAFRDEGLKNGVFTWVSPVESSGHFRNTLEFLQDDQNGDAYARSRSTWNGKAPICLYKRVAKTRVELERIVYDKVKSLWQSSLQTISQMTDEDIQNFCAWNKTHPYSYAYPDGKRGFCEASSSLDDRNRMIETFQAALSRLEREHRFSQQDTFGTFYQSDYSFGERALEQRDSSLRREECEGLGLQPEQCALRADIMVAASHRQKDIFGK